MKVIKNKFIALALLCFAGIFLNACDTIQSAATDPAIAKPPPAAPIVSDESAPEHSIPFLENRLKNDLKISKLLPIDQFNRHGGLSAQ